MATTPANSDKEPRTERGRRTLRRLIEAAAAEFGERGFHEAAITGITRRAGAPSTPISRARRRCSGPSSST
jgi:AcrR family transcriptional regulator